MTWLASIRALFLAAMAVFLVTIGIGIVNGLDLYEFDHNQLLTHVHTGTLGWITLSLVAIATWHAKGIDRRLALGLATLVPLYALGFLVAPAIRSVLGAVLLVGIVALVVWAWGRFRAMRSLPALAVALGFTTFAYGAIIGVLIQVQLAGGPLLFPAGANVVAAHGSTMVFAYLILLAVGLLEWRVRDTQGVPRAGVVQLVALFMSGALLSFTFLFLPVEAQQPIGGLVLLLEIIGVGLFAARVLPKALRTDWTAGAGRHFAASSIFVVVAVGIFVYVIARVISDPTLDLAVPPMSGVLIASDHSAFIGVVTNLVLGSLFTLTAREGRRGGIGEQVAFWGTNVGLAVFLAGLVLNTAILKQIGAPVMGISLLVALAVLAPRLWGSRFAEDRQLANPALAADAA
jgi:hypothetical protein